VSSREEEDLLSSLWKFLSKSSLSFLITPLQNSALDYL